MLKKLMLFILLNLLLSNVFAQHFSLGIETIRSPGEIMINNYTALPFSIEGKENHVFDQNNLYTYTIVVKDEQGLVYHILYQTDFLDALQYLAISNNLLKYFDCENNPIRNWHSCLHKTTADDLPSEVIKNKIYCIMSRLNSCGY